jgi:hypothetical protein
VAGACATCDTDDELLFTCRHRERRFCERHELPHHACERFQGASRRGDDTPEPAETTTTTTESEAQATTAATVTTETPTEQSPLEPTRSEPTTARPPRRGRLGLHGG